MSLAIVLSRLALMLAVLVAPGSPALAQNPFETVAMVNESVVTRYEVAQRERLQQVLRVPGANAETALQSLIDDRLKLAAAREADAMPTDEAVQQGVEDFAARANLTGEQLIQALKDVGIDRETVYDYVRALVAWGDVLREKYNARARPTDAEIDQAIALGGGQGAATRVLLSEIVLPMAPELAQLSQERATAIAGLRSFDDFSAAAARFSIAPSRNNGGKLDWMPLSALPPQLGPMFLSMQPGDVTQPFPGPDGLILYQLRGIEDARPGLSGNNTIDFVIVRFPPGTNLNTELARLALVTETCDDLYGVFKGADENTLQRKSEARDKMGGVLAQKVDLLDPGEMALLPAQAGEGGAILMLCSRSVIRDQQITREDVRRQLFARRLEALGDAYLAELRSDAVISAGK